MQAGSTDSPEETGICHWCHRRFPGRELTTGRLPGRRTWNQFCPEHAKYIKDSQADAPRERCIVTVERKR